MPSSPHNNHTTSSLKKHTTTSAAANHQFQPPPENMRSSASYYSAYGEPHFLDSCFLCHRPLSQHNDIFMYRGNTPFCSQECRQEQIEMDEANEKRWKISSGKRSNTVRQTTKESTKESDTNKAVRTGTVAVA